MERRVAGSILELIGWTPLVKLNRITSGLPSTVYAKLEYFNPGGGVKDRVGLSMISDPELLHAESVHEPIKPVCSLSNHRTRNLEADRREYRRPRCGDGDGGDNLRNGKVPQRDEPAHQGSRRRP